MKFGITDSELETITNVFLSSDKVDRAVLFGSRVKNDFRPGSDIDIAIYGVHLRFDDFLSLAVQVDALDLLYKIDLVRFESIESLELIDHINRLGVTIYDRNQIGK